MWIPPDKMVGGWRLWEFPIVLLMFQGDCLFSPLTRLCWNIIMICDRNGSGVHKVASFINFQLFLYLYQTPFFMVTGLHKPVARKGPPNCLGLGGFKDFSWDFFTNELEEIKIFFFDLVFPLGAPRPDHGLLGHLPGLKQNSRHGCSHAHTLVRTINSNEFNPNI